MPGFAVAYTGAAYDQALIWCAGSLPTEWFTAPSTLSSSILTLNLGDNCLSGSIPRAAGGNFAPMNSKSDSTGAKMILVPMKVPYGLCGPIPSNMTVFSAQQGRLQGIMPAGACPGLHTICPPLRHRIRLSYIVRMTIWQILCCSTAKRPSKRLTKDMMPSCSVTVDLAKIP